jgi:aryl-alcohol dehydrogenase-like predicted oxidoreductase
VLTTSIGGIDVGRIGFGCFALSGGYGSADERSALKMIHAALDLGVTLLDTSDAYAAGANEVLVGRAVAGRRDQAVIATKFGWVLNDAGVPVRLDSSPTHVRLACEASLTRLGTDRIDIYIQHRVDPATPIEETMGELERLREEGKIRAIGLSEAGTATLERAHKAASLAALQTEYSLWSRDPERDLLPLCQKLGVTFVAYSPLGRGFLTGSVRHAGALEPTDFRRSQPRFQEENLRQNLAFVDRLAEMALGLGCTPSQLALAWILAQPWGIVPIPATRRSEHLIDNVRALDVRLSPADLETINTAIPASDVHGARHPAEHMKTIDQ